MARRKGVAGWHSMRKDQLVQILARLARTAQAKAAKAAKNGAAPKKGGPALAGRKTHRVDAPQAAVPKPRPSRIEKRIRQIQDRLAVTKDLAFRSVTQNNGCSRDRLVAMVRDPYWLQVYWELTRATVERAEAAMGQHWHGARPVLRLSEVTRDGTTSSVRRHLRDVEIHGSVNNWYVDVPSPPKSFQFDIGYLALNGKFLSLARSNVVTTPRAGAPEGGDGNWGAKGEDYDRIYALSGGYANSGDNAELKELFEQRLRRPMSPLATRFGLGAGGVGVRRADFHLEIDTELIVYGATDPGAHVTVKGEPVRLAEDGTFALRFDLPDRRHVLPVVANSTDGAEQRTIVLAVERNTKVMEPVLRDPDAAARD